MFADDGPEPPEEEKAAKDGLPSAREETADELKARREAQSKKKGRSVAERAENGDDVVQPDEEEDGQWTFFAAEENGKTVTHAQLVKRGTPTEVRYKMTGKAIPNTDGGIVDPSATSVMLAVDAVVDDVDIQYIRDSNQRIEKVIYYVTMKPREVQNAATKAGQALLANAATKAAAAS